MNASKDSLWVERFRPFTTLDVIAPKNTEKFLKEIVKTKQLPNIIFHGSAGIGKTSTAKALARDLGSDLLYINGSLETSVDVIRDRVMQHAMTHSVMSMMGDDDEKKYKIVVIDEVDRISGNAQDSLKVVLEEASSNCRFIFCTNNLQKIILPLQSRCKIVSFNYGKEESQHIMLAYFKRIQFILESEGYTISKDDKGILAEYVQNFFPDFRKMLNELQGFLMSNGKIDLSLLKTGNSSMTEDIIELIKAKQFSKMSAACSNIEPSSFFTSFYTEIKKHVKPEALPDIIFILRDGMHTHALAVDQEINLIAVCTELMQALNGKWK